MSILIRRLLSHRPYPKFFSPQRALLSSMPQTRSAKAILSHQERTATEPRDKDLYTAVVSKIKPVNDRIKTFRFDIKDKNGFNV